MVLDPRLEKRVVVAVIDSAHQIWLAGLGAFVKTEREGSRFFEALVEEGEEVEATIKHAASKKVERIKGKATDKWNKLEEVFQRRVARAINRLGVPSNDDIQGLYRQVEELDQNVNELARLRGVDLVDRPAVRVGS